MIYQSSTTPFAYILIPDTPHSSSSDLSIVFLNPIHPCCFCLSLNLQVWSKHLKILFGWLQCRKIHGT